MVQSDSTRLVFVESSLLAPVEEKPEAIKEQKSSTEQGPAVAFQVEKRRRADQSLAMPQEQ